MKRLILMRGLPGSGKSTLAKQILDEHYTQYCHSGLYSKQTDRGYIISSDDYFTIDNQYFFNSQFTAQSHMRCNFLCVQLMLVEAALIIIDNTNLTTSAIQPYLEYAACYGYDLQIREPETEWKYDVDECTKRNKHNVPKEIISMMLEKLELQNEEKFC